MTTQMNGRAGDVVLQAFRATSAVQHPTAWYRILQANAATIRDHFDVVWFPPPSASVTPEGYMPTRWYDFDSAYGSEADLRAAIDAVRPARALVNLVVNHRCGVASGGVDFDDPPFPDNAAAVVREDESHAGTGAPDTGERSDYARDLDHTNEGVRETIHAFLGRLKALGFTGLRFDDAKGYAAQFAGDYASFAAADLAVAEVWLGDRQGVVDWIDRAGGRVMAYDFPTRYLLRDAIRSGTFTALAVAGVPAGAVGWWPEMSVTFVEDHDTDWTAPTTGGPFGDAEQILQGYAYILTHPGIPCVFWSHVFEWTDAMRGAILRLIGVRRASDVGRDSRVSIAAAEHGRYAAIVDDRLAVKIGDAPWDPGAGWQVAADGARYAVWTRG